MRAILIAATALAALTTSAQAQVDHVSSTERPSSPACVTPLHLDEAYALIEAGRPVNPDVCLMLKGGTEVVRVQSFGGRRQIAYQVNGKTFVLFMDDHAMADEMEERRLYGIKVRKENEEAYLRRQAENAEWKRKADELYDTEQKRDRCFTTLGPFHPACTYLQEKVLSVGK